jgi:predicted MFS family arabinose efflux permease
MINHCFCNIIYGATFDSYGPFVPYLSEATGLPESSFTIIFTMRGVGYILAGILKLKLMRNIDLHRALGISCISAGLSSMLFFTNLHLIWLGLFSLCLSVFACFFDIFSNIAVLQCGKNREAFYLGIAFTFQSVGNGLGPFLVSLIGLKAYSITGFCFVIGGIIYMIFPKFA